jgi:NAD+ kinase
MPQALQRVWRGEFVLESRALIEVCGRCSGRSVHNRALNDFVVSRGIVSRLITLEVSVDDEPLTRYRCDGLIVSSPTGSTAYSLSAGGAVVHPQADVFELTPICPHTLSNRSVIVSLDSLIHVKVISPKPDTILSADGQGICEMSAGDVVTICRSRDSVRLVHLAGSSFFETLRRKLHWSGANV